MTIKKVVVAGGGVLGSQITFQTAYHDIEVVNWLRMDSSIGRAKPKYALLHKTYLEILEAMKTTPEAYAVGLAERDVTPDQLDLLKEKVDNIYQDLNLTTDLAAALKDADLVIEAIPEVLEDKREFYKKLNDLVDPKTIICTNSSTFIPSQFVDVIDHPERYLALHFANNIWAHNTAEVMGHAGTDPQAFQAVVDYCHAIRMEPLELKKEHHGYLLNSLLIPFLNAGLALWVDEIADPATIDKTWMLATGAPCGPFKMMDIIGITTQYHILASDPRAQDPDSLIYRAVQKLKAMMDANKRGVVTGEGFFKYH